MLADTHRADDQRSAGAMIAEIVENTAAAQRSASAARSTTIRDYYAIRNHLIDFLVGALEERSGDDIPDGSYDPPPSADRAAGRRRRPAPTPAARRA